MEQPKDRPALSKLEDPAMIARVVALLLSYGFRWPPAPAPTKAPEMPGPSASREG